MSTTPDDDGNPWRVFNTEYGWMVQDRVRNWYPSSEAVARRFAAWKFRRWLKTSEFARRLHATPPREAGQ